MACMYLQLTRFAKRIGVASKILLLFSFIRSKKHAREQSRQIFSIIGYILRGFNFQSKGGVAVLAPIPISC